MSFLRGLAIKVVRAGNEHQIGHFLSSECSPMRGIDCTPMEAPNAVDSTTDGLNTDEIQFENNVFGALGAITIGNVITYGTTPSDYSADGNLFGAPKGGTPSSLRY